MNDEPCALLLFFVFFFFNLNYFFYLMRIASNERETNVQIQQVSTHCQVQLCRNKIKKNEIKRVS